ncbi:16S rRNA (cytosine(1402)-N(4))-methyltransferase RsmH [Candidatus Margulisiibacteriota bacterium]
MSGKFNHIPVLLKESIDFLNVRKGQTYVDCTLGGGGHSQGILSPLPLGEGIIGVRVFGIEVDSDALAAAKEKLGNSIEYVHDNFRNLKNHIKKPVAGFLFDLGVSSYQIDEAARGFSIKKDGPLDMRMDKSQKLTASDILNRSSQEELEKIFKEYGEERFSRRIAKAVEQQRPLTTTKQLKEIVEQAIPTWKKRESVTRIFQALRIAVNQELDSLKLALSDAIELLRPGGRIVVISYHSLEDRIVKQTFRQAEQLKVLTKKPLRANEAEISSNPRARSAKLRAGEKL